MRNSTGREIRRGRIVPLPVGLARRVDVHLGRFDVVEMVRGKRAVIGSCSGGLTCVNYPSWNFWSALVTLAPPKGSTATVTSVASLAANAQLPTARLAHVARRHLLPSPIGPCGYEYSSTYVVVRSIRRMIVETPLLSTPASPLAQKDNKVNLTSPVHQAVCDSRSDPFGAHGPPFHSPSALQQPRRLYFVSSLFPRYYVWRGQKILCRCNVLRTILCFIPTPATMRSRCPLVKKAKWCGAAKTH